MQNKRALEVVDQRIFTAEFYHLKVENPFFGAFSCFRPPNEGKGPVWELILVSLESPYPLS
jgi:hypothetical protein